MYQKRSKVNKIWPVPRKGTKYVAAALDNSSIPALILLRDLLKIGKTKKEVKDILKTGKVKVNKKILKEERYPIKLFDIISIDSENYKLIISENKKYSLEKIAEKEAGEKIAKVVKKKILKGKKTQVNLSDGRNYIINENPKTGTIAIIDLEKNKIKGYIEMKKGSKVAVIGGKHKGINGIIKNIEKINKEIAELDNKINVETKNLIVVG